MIYRLLYSGLLLYNAILNKTYNKANIHSIPAMARVVK